MNCHVDPLTAWQCPQIADGEDGSIYGGQLWIQRISSSGQLPRGGSPTLGWAGPNNSSPSNTCMLPNTGLEWIFWIRIESSGRLLWTKKWTFMYQKRWKLNSDYWLLYSWSSLRSAFSSTHLYHVASWINITSCLNHCGTCISIICMLSHFVHAYLCSNINT
jgi:hypothetical protein